MRKKKPKTKDEKIDYLIELLQLLVALEYSKAGVPQVVIGKRLGLKTATVGAMLEGVKKEKK